MKQSRLVTIISLAFVAFIAVLILSNSIFLTIQPGEKGVLFKRFGGGLDKENIYSQGFHIIMPWNTMTIYDVRLHEAFEKMDVLSKNGLTIKCDLSYRYRPVPEKIGYLHDDIGPDYHNRILIPEIRSATREVIGKYDPEELYSSKRQTIQEEIYELTRAKANEKNIILDAILIREVVLPVSLQQAIERKLKEEQASLEYEFRLEKEKKEAERKLIAARANAEANRILSASLTDKILRDKGVEATLKLAQSENSKVIVVGGNEDGLPLILGQ
jgi:regulator of protease activity HflC (stomatin/prohibitin superfamily)